MHSLLIAPILLPMLGGIPILFLYKRDIRRLYIVVLLVLELLLLVTLDWSAPPVRLLTLSPNASLMLGPDALGRLFAILVAGLWLVVAIFAYEYMTHESHPARFFGFYVISLGSLIGICLSANLVTLYMFYEMMTLLTIPLVIHSGTRKAVDAGIKYMGFSVCGACLSLLGLFFLQSCWTTDLFTPGGVLAPAAAAGQSGLLTVSLFLMLIGFGAKAGLFPLFVWLPTAHPVAPSPASAVLSGLITKMGVLAILRVIYFQFGVDFVSGSWAQKVALGLAIFTIFMGSMLAFKEKVLKKRLAYSTVSQVSYILFGLLALNPTAFSGALYQIVFHAVAKNGLFLSAGSIIYHTHATHVNELRGIGKNLPCSMWGFTLCGLSLIGIPPTAGFVSKWYLAQGGLELGVLGFVGVSVLMVSALLTAGYLLPIVADAFFPGSDHFHEYDHEHEHKRESSWLIRVPLLLLGAGVVVLGAFPGILDPFTAPILAMLFP